MTQQSRFLVSVCILTALGLLHVSSLAHLPFPHVDEAWFADRAWSLVTCGVPLGTLDYGILNWYSGAPRFFPFLPVVVQAGMLSMVGEPSLFWLRTISLGSGTCLAIALWYVAVSLYDRTVALLSVVLLTASIPFIYSAHLARYDIMAVALGYGGVAAYLSHRRWGSWSPVLAGFLSGLATEFHPFSIVIAAGLVSLWLYDHGLQGLRRLNAWALIAGVIGGLSVYPLLHIITIPDDYVTLTALIYGPTHVPRPTQALVGFNNGLQILLDSFGILSIGMVAAFAALCTSKQASDRRTVVLAVGVFTAFGLVLRNKLPYYTILVTPPFVLCLAVGVQRTALSKSAGALRAAPLVVSTLLVVQSAFDSHRALGYDNGDFVKIEQRLASVISQRDAVMGSQMYWFGLNKNVFYSWEQLIYLQRGHEGMSATQALTLMRPDVLIRDAHLDKFLLDRPGETLYTRLLWLPRPEIESWLAQNSSVVDRFDSGLYGTVTVYRLHWPSGQTGLPRPRWSACLPTASSNVGALEPGAPSDQKQ